MRLLKQPIGWIKSRTKMSDHTQSGTERARVARTLLVNATMVQVFYLQKNITQGRIPSVIWFTKKEAEAAAVAVRDTDIGKSRNAKGTTTVTCFVEPKLVPSLYAWALAGWADGECARDG